MGGRPPPPLSPPPLPPFPPTFPPSATGFASAAHGAPPPSAPLGAAPATSFLSELCAGFANGDPSLDTFIDKLAAILIAPDILAQLTSATGGGLDYALVCADLEAELERLASASTPPLAPSQWRPIANPNFSTYQAAMVTFSNVQRRQSLQPQAVSSLAGAPFSNANFVSAPMWRGS